MKKLFVLLSAAILLAGCEGLSTPALDKPESVERVKQSIEKYINLDEYKLVEVKWGEIDKLSNKLEDLSVLMVGKDGKVYSQYFRISGSNQGPVKDMEPSKFKYREGTYDFATVPHITLNDIDPQTVMKQMEEAGKLVDAELYKIESVYHYTQGVNIAEGKKKGEKETEFVFRIIDKSGSTSVKGKNIVTTYYEMEFEVAEDGTVTMVE